VTEQTVSESSQASHTESCCDPTAECQEVMERMTTDAPLEMCPMAGFCKGMMETKGRGSGFLLVIPGILFIAIGVLILLAPNVLVWLVAGSLIVFGIIALLAGIGMRRFLAKS